MEAKLERSGGDEGREERDDSSLCSLLFWFAVIEYSNEFNRVLRPCREQLSHDRFCLPGDDVNSFLMSFNPSDSRGHSQENECRAQSPLR